METTLWHLVCLALAWKERKRNADFFWSAGLPYAEEDEDRNNADVF
jgi:hypothetical protein